MEQHTAVKKMMLTIKVEEIIPVELFPLIREYLQQMYAVGYDAGRQRMCEQQKYQESVIQKNSEGKVINVFPSIRIAAKYTGYSRTTIKNAIHNNKKARGFYWKILTKERLQEECRDRYMY